MVSIFKVASTSFADLSLNKWNEGEISLQERPMFSAVSSLSPVSIQILIPAS
jgi:hypothetical protein